jgi:hypothetical protein
LSPEISQSTLFLKLMVTTYWIAHHSLVISDHTFAPPLTVHCQIYARAPEMSPETLTLNMGKAMFARILPKTSNFLSCLFLKAEAIIYPAA